MTAPTHQLEDSGEGTTLLFVAGVNRMSANALSVAASLGIGRLEAVTVTSEAAKRQEIRQAWADARTGIPLTVIANEHEDWVRSAAAYVRSLHPDEHHPVVVLLPELFVRHRYQRFLHNQSCKRLKAELLEMPCVDVVSVPVNLPERTRRDNPPWGRSLS